MSIPIDDNTRFSMNTDNYVLEHRVKAGIRPDGKPNVSQFKWIIEGYYPSVASMLISYVTNAPRRENNGKIHTLQGVVDCILEAEKKIEKLLPKNN